VGTILKNKHTMSSERGATPPNRQSVGSFLPRNEFEIPVRNCRSGP